MSDWDLSTTTPSPGETGALVIGRDYGALGIIRSLGRQGIPVWLLEEALSNASVSRYLRWRSPWPDQATENHQLAYLLDLCDEHDLDGWSIFPASDEAAALVAHHHAVLSARYRLTPPPWKVMRWAYDKRLTYQLAADVGIDHPWTFCPRSREELASLDCAFPVILKPAIKPHINRLTTAKAWRVEDRARLLARYDEACKLVDPHVILVQELIPGGGETQFSFAALCEDGRPLAWAITRRTRQYPLDFGRFSTYVETIDQPAIEEPSRRLIAAMRYSGVVEIEYKRDPRSGAYKPLDINGRIWAWHTLGRRAGVDFPYLQWRAIHGEPVPETRARTGVRWMRALTDIPAAMGAIRAGQLSPADYARSFRRPIEFAVFAPDDPLPFLADVPLLARRAWHRWRGPARGRAGAAGGCSASAWGSKPRAQPTTRTVATRRFRDERGTQRSVRNG